MTLLLAQAAADRVALLTPVVKAFLTDKGFDSCVESQQVFGGHGFIREWGMEQYVRDTRISQIYEGTNGVQAQDLMGRKVAKNNGVFVASFIAEIRDFNATLAGDANLAFIHNALEQAAKEIEVATQWVIEQANRNPDEINAAAVRLPSCVWFVVLCLYVGKNGQSGRWQRRCVLCRQNAFGTILCDTYVARVNFTLGFIKVRF
jgi:hypothetical protein